MNRIFAPFFFLISLIIIQSCKTVDPYAPKTVEKKALVARIKLHVNSLNEQNKIGLESVYALDYEGLFPVTKFRNKKELIDILLKNQKANNVKIESKILEIHARQSMGYALLHWVAIAHPESPQEEILYERKHFQVWEKDDQKNWRLKRSLFY